MRRHATIAIFVIAYILVMAEELIHLRKSKPLIWVPIIALGYAASILTHLWINTSLF